jgi:hypothetical protein
MHANGCQKPFGRFCFLPIALISLLATAVGANAATNQHPLCRALAAGKVHASSGAQMWCFGPQSNGPKVHVSLSSLNRSGGGFTSDNVDAASLSEDITTNGERGDGQSETSIAAAGKYVVEGWNDSTGLSGDGNLSGKYTECV